LIWFIYIIFNKILRNLKKHYIFAAMILETRHINYLPNFNPSVEAPRRRRTPRP